MDSSKPHEISLEENEMLRVQLLRERVVSASEAVNTATLTQQVRQSELDAFVLHLNNKYQPQDDMELKGFNPQNNTMVFEPKVGE